MDEEHASKACSTYWVFKVRVLTLPFLETIRLDEELVWKTSGPNGLVCSSHTVSVFQRRNFLF
jgi:hypothetical protein